MAILRAAGRFLLGVLKTLRLALPKIGVGWMFALLTSNFNQVTIHDLGVMAALVTIMVGMHHFISPFQIVMGRIADRHPILGYRRTPYLIVGALVASLIFLVLPPVALGMSRGDGAMIALGFVLFVLYGMSLATMGDCHHSLIAEVTSEKTRGGTIAVVWTFTILSGIASAGVIKTIMPTYNYEQMQMLYNLTPLVVMGATLLGVVGLERRLRGEALTRALEVARKAVPGRNPLTAARSVLAQNPQARSFFIFVFFAIMGIFLQDQVLEVFGREVFGMTLKETTTFQQYWGGGVLIGMIVMGIISSVLPLSKKLIASVGGIGTAFGLGILSLSAITGREAMLTPALVLMGLSAGMFNVGALALMMSMTVEGATGLYMGLWGVAQAFGNGLSSIVSGSLKTLLIETGLMTAQWGYGTIFGLEALLMVVAVAALASVNVEAFRGLTRTDLTRAMEVGAAA